MSNVPPQGPRGNDPHDPRNMNNPQDPYDPNQEEWVEEEVYEEKTPITKQPVFWIALIAAVAALLALGYLLGDNDGDSNDATTSVVVVDETTEVVTPEEDPAATETATATQTVVDQQRETVLEQQPATAPAPAPGEAPAGDDAAAGQDEAAQRNEEALNEAENLLADEPYSKQGLYDRLTSQEGGAYPQEAAQHAVDNIGADWNNEALRAAEKIREDNPDATGDEIFDQLTDDNEWNFTDEEAQYAVDRIG